MKQLVVGILVSSDYAPIYQGAELTHKSKVALANYLGAALYAATSILCFIRFAYLRHKEKSLQNI